MPGYVDRNKPTGKIGHPTTKFFVAAVSCLLFGFLLAYALSPRSLTEMEAIAKSELISFLAYDHKSELIDSLIGPVVALPVIPYDRPRLAFLWKGITPYGDTVVFSVRVPNDRILVQLFFWDDALGTDVSCDINSYYLLSTRVPLSRAFKRPIAQDDITIDFVPLEIDNISYQSLQADSLLLRKVYNSHVGYGELSGNSLKVHFLEPIGVVATTEGDTTRLDTTHVAVLTQIGNAHFTLTPWPSQ